MRPTGRGFVKEDASGRPSQQSREIRCDACDHQHVNLNLFEYISVGLNLKVREPGKKKPEVETSVRGSHEHRFSRKPSGAIQLVWEKGELTHIHCKICNNQWKSKECESHADRFEVSKDVGGTIRIRCLKCAREYLSG